MRGLSVTAALTALLAATEGLRYDPVARTVAVDFHRSTQSARPAGARLAKRQAKTLSDNITWGGLLYYINITLGTPGQPAAVWLDTGSSDLWVPDTGSNICQTSQEGCSSNGGFNPAQSSSYKTVQPGAFEIAYASGDQIKGDYGDDILVLDGTTLEDVVFGVAKDGQTDTPLSGIMGIGYTVGESLESQIGTTYPNVVDKLVSSGAIATKTYSLYLNDLANGHGTILFGGVDQDKYSGELGIVDVQFNELTQAYDTFTVVLSSLTFNANGQTNNVDLGGDLPVILDSGTTLTYLPNDIATAIYDGLGVTYDSVDGPFVPCDVDTSNMYFTFTFGSDDGVAIQVDLGQFVLPFEAGNQLPTINGGQACSFGLFPSGSVANGEGDILFGDTFLRSAYLVYDLDNNQIGMAQTKFDASDSNVVAISAGAAASTNVLPAATTVSDQVTIVQSANPTSEGAEGTGGAVASNGAASTNTVPTSVSATYKGISNGGLATGTTVPSQPGATSSSSKKSDANLCVPPFQWAAASSGLVVLVMAALGGGWFIAA